MSDKFRINGVSHTAFATSDINKTVRFWRDLLHLKLVVTMDTPTGRQYFFSLGASSYISFFEWPNVKNVPMKRHGEPVEGPAHFDHLSLSVPTQNDLFHIQRALEAADFPVSDVVDHGFLHSIYTYDPNGIPLEFSWCMNGIDPKENPTFTESKTTVTASEGPNPVGGVWPTPTDPFDPSEHPVVKGEGSDMYSDRETI